MKKILLGLAILSAGNTMFSDNGSFGAGLTTGLVAGSVTGALIAGRNKETNPEVSEHRRLNKQIKSLQSENKVSQKRINTLQKQSNKRTLTSDESNEMVEKKSKIKTNNKSIERIQRDINS